VKTQGADPSENPGLTSGAGGPRILQQENNMSKKHGDTARFHRIRKQNIARRLMVRELRAKIAAAAAPALVPVKVD